EAQLAVWPGMQIIAQPTNLGTGPGILLPLAHLRTLHADARVAIFPSDHHMKNAAPFLRGVTTAMAATGDTVTLLGIAPEHPDGDLGWIVPSREPGELRAVHRFVEKPSRRVARRLMQAGGLWNSFV